MEVPVTEDSSYLARMMQWFEQHAEPCLDSTNGDTVSFKAELKKITDLQQTIVRSLPVCFLGNSNVGKSTIINAIVAGHEYVLPQGGVGPLTAQATTVEYSETRYFKIAYHGAEILRGVLRFNPNV
jgi:ribosome biogenesis GTPase A